MIHVIVTKSIRLPGHQAVQTSQTDNWWKGETIIRTAPMRNDFASGGYELFPIALLSG